MFVKPTHWRMHTPKKTYKKGRSQREGGDIEGCIRYSLLLKSQTILAVWSVSNWWTKAFFAKLTFTGFSLPFLSSHYSSVLIQLQSTVSLSLSLIPPFSSLPILLSHCCPSIRKFSSCFAFNLTVYQMFCTVCSVMHILTVIPFFPSFVCFFPTVKVHWDHCKWLPTEFFSQPKQWENCSNCLHKQNVKLSYFL